MTFSPPDARFAASRAVARCSASAARGGRSLRAALGVLIWAALSAQASALIISPGSPAYSLPGGGSCSISGITTTGTGATVTCTGINLSAHTKVYFGIKNNSIPNGNTMTGVTPGSGSAAVFRSSSTGASSITYTSTTTINSAIPAFGTDTVTSTLTLTRVAGTASVVATGGTPANSPSFGDIGHLFQITSGSTLTLDVDISASVPHASGQACPAVYDPTHSTFGNGGDWSRVDVAFYFSDCGDGQVDTPEQCDAGAANGTLGSCCSSGCTFKSNGTACTDDGNQCTNDQCNGASATCLHPNKTNGTSCVGNGSGECSNADTCVSGVCQNNDLSGGTPCSDSSPTNCKAARCNGSNVCDQNFTNEANGAPCTGANGTGECTNPDTCLAGVCQDNDLGAGTPCTDLSPTDCKDARCNGSNACVQTFANEPDGNPCAGNGVGECSNADICATGACADNDVISGTPCGSSGDSDCDNPDTCNGSGSCQVNNEPSSVVCRAATTGGVCDEVENCDGAGNCPADGFKSGATECRPDAGECDVPENCTGSSPFCPSDGFEPAATACGDPSDTDCDHPDTCDGNNTCLDNLESAGTACGDPSNTDCDNPDSCNASGTCLVNNEPGGTPCGDPSNTDCTDPDTCDGAAACLSNDASNGSSCNDGDACTTGESCTTGVCGGGADACPDLDHYKCYQGKDLKNPKFVKLEGLDTDDQLSNELVDVKKLKFVCAPVDKNGEGINAPNRHLACYQLSAPTFGSRPKVEVSTQFQTSQFEIKKGKLLCLPATKTVLP